MRACSPRGATAGVAAALLAVAVSGCGVMPGGAGQPPIPDRSISLVGHCAQIEDDGFREQAALRVHENVVESFDWRLWVGTEGSCGFAHADFRQTKLRPHIELAARDGSGCTLMVWQDGTRITLAHAGCEARCTPGIYDRAWPVMFDPVTGRCAATSRG